AALVHQTIERHPPVMFDLQPDGGVGLLVVAGDVQGGRIKTRAQKLALPSAQRLANRAFSQRQGRSPGRKSQRMAVREARRPTRRSKQAILATKKLEGRRLATGRYRPCPRCRSLDIQQKC